MIWAYPDGNSLHVIRSGFAMGNLEWNIMEPLETKSLKIHNRISSSKCIHEKDQSVCNQKRSRSKQCQQTRNAANSQIAFQLQPLLCSKQSWLFMVWFFFVVMLQVFPMNIGQTHVLDGQFHVWQVNPIDFIICNKSTIWTKNWLKVNPFSCFNIPTFRWSKHIQTPMYHVWISRIGQIRRFQHSPTWMALIQHLFFGITKIYYPVVI